MLRRLLLPLLQLLLFLLRLLLPALELALQVGLLLWEVQAHEAHHAVVVIQGEGPAAGEEAQGKERDQVR